MYVRAYVQLGSYAILTGNGMTAYVCLYVCTVCPKWCIIYVLQYARYCSLITYKLRASFKGTRSFCYPVDRISRHTLYRDSMSVRICFCSWIPSLCFTRFHFRALFRGVSKLKTYKTSGIQTYIYVCTVHAHTYIHTYMYIAYLCIRTCMHVLWVRMYMYVCVCVFVHDTCNFPDPNHTGLCVCHGTSSSSPHTVIIRM